MPRSGSTRDNRDVYYRQAKTEGWRARSAFKLLQIDEEFGIFGRGDANGGGLSRVVDLCAAPGSWSQVLSRRIVLPYRERQQALRRNRCQRNEMTDPADASPSTAADAPIIVAVDLQRMAPIEGVVQLQGDITDARTVDRILGHFNCGRTSTSTSTSAAAADTRGDDDGAADQRLLADLVVCDGAPDVTGLHDIDEAAQSHLLLAALAVVVQCLREGGNYVSKVFLGPSRGETTLSQLSVLFEHAEFFKPRSSRLASAEHFVVCRNFRPPRGFHPRMLHDILSDPTSAVLPPLPKQVVLSDLALADGHDAADDAMDDAASVVANVVVPFLACGDLSGIDAVGAAL